LPGLVVSKLWAAGRLWGLARGYRKDGGIYVVLQEVLILELAPRVIGYICDISIWLTQ
jgi:hypothetical protein